MNKYSDIKCVCGSNNYKKIFSGNFNRLNLANYYFEIIKCKNCRLVRTYPVPDISMIKRSESYNFSSDIDRMEEFDNWSRHIVKLAKKYIALGNLLDIGCFAGRLLEEAKREGFRACGVELCQKAAEYGKAKGRNIFPGDVYEVGFQGSFFSCVVMNHVLEHVLDPLRLIKEIDRILRPGGILIINTPAYNSLMRFAMGENWLQWSPHVHAFFYTKKVLRDIIKNNSQLKPVSIHQRGRLETVPVYDWRRSRLKELIAGLAKLIDKGEQIEAVFIKK